MNPFKQKRAPVFNPRILGNLDKEVHPDARRSWISEFQASGFTGCSGF